MLVGGLRPIVYPLPPTIPAILPLPRPVLILPYPHPARGMAVDLFPGASFRVPFPSLPSRSMSVMLPIGCLESLQLFRCRWRIPGILSKHKKLSSSMTLTRHIGTRIRFIRNKNSFYPLQPRSPRSKYTPTSFDWIELDWIGFNRLSVCLPLPLHRHSRLPLLLPILHVS